MLCSNAASLLKPPVKPQGGHAQLSLDLLSEGFTLTKNTI